MANEFGMPPVSAGYDARAGWLVNKLLADFAPEGMKNFQAAGLTGVLGGESGLKAVQEVNPSGRGGFGWEQATGSRRDDFDKWSRDHGLTMVDDEANYGFMVNELRGSENKALVALLATTSLEAAVDSFCRRFERPGDPESEIRRSIPLAQRALAASMGLPHPQAGSGAGPSASIDEDTSADELNRQELDRIKKGLPPLPPTPTAPNPNQGASDGKSGTGDSSRMAPGVAIGTGATGGAAFTPALQYIAPLLHLPVPTPEQGPSLVALAIAVGAFVGHLWYSWQWRKGNR